MIDAKNYSVACAGVTHQNLTRDEALDMARSLVAEWATYGYRRTARVLYRDGSVIWTVSREGSLEVQS